MIYSTKNKVRIIPWDQSSAVDIDEMYTQLTWLKDHRKPSGVTQNKLGSYTEIFNGGKRLLVYGRPGMHSNFFLFQALHAEEFKKYQVRYSTNVYLGRLRPEVQTITLLCTIFHEKGYRFHIPCLRLCIPFNCCKCTVFSIGISHKNRTFSQLNKP